MRLVNHPTIARYFMRMSTRSERYVDEEIADADSLLARLDEEMRTDIGAFQNERKWGPNRDMTGSELMYALMKKREEPAAA